MTDMDATKDGGKIPIANEEITIDMMLNQPTRISKFVADAYSERWPDGRTLFDKIFSPTAEEIEARKANDTDDIAPAKGFDAPRYVLKKARGYEALQFTGDNIAEMKAFVGEGEGGSYGHGRKVKKNHVDLSLDYYDTNNGMADVGDYVVHDIDSDEWWAMEAEWFEKNYVGVG